MSGAGRQFTAENDVSRHHCRVINASVLPSPHRHPSTDATHVRSHRTSFPEISYFKECHVVTDGEVLAPVRIDMAQAKPKGDGDDDGLWAASQEDGGAKQGDEEWVAHAQWLRHDSKQKPHEQGGLPLAANEHAVLASGAVEGDRVEEIESVSLSAFVFLVLALGAVFVVWNKSRKTHRRTS